MLAGGAQGMREAFFSLLLSLAANLDNLGVGIAYGIMGIRVPPLSNLLIAAQAFLLTALPAATGGYVRLHLPVAWARSLGAAVITGVGLWVMSPLARRGEAGSHPDGAAGRAWSPAAVLRHPDRADQDRSGEISPGEAGVVGFALSVNAVAGGLGAGLVGLKPWLVAALTGLFSYLTLWAGASLGRRLASRPLGRGAVLVAGLLLVLVGLQHLFQR